MSVYLSAFGAKRTCRDCGLRINRSLTTHKRHRPPESAVMQNAACLTSYSGAALGWKEHMRRRECTLFDGAEAWSRRAPW
jgi:hypothetical protein